MNLLQTYVKVEFTNDQHCCKPNTYCMSAVHRKALNAKTYYEFNGKNNQTNKGALVNNERAWTYYRYVKVEFTNNQHCCKLYTYCMSAVQRRALNAKIYYECNGKNKQKFQRWIAVFVHKIHTERRKWNNVKDANNKVMPDWKNANKSF